MNNKWFLISSVGNLIYEDSDEEEEVLLLIKTKQRRTCIKHYIDVISSYTISEFKAHFRLNKTTVGILIEKFGGDIYDVTSAGGRTTSPEKQLLVTIWMLGNQEVYRSIADRFDISISTVWEYVHRVVRVLIKNVKTYIKWPGNMETVSRKFRLKHGIPGVVGAIDGSHIPIISPTEQANSYLNRKQFHSINLQAICDSQYIFIDCFAGCPGSVHDARVYRISPISKQIDNILNESQHLLGDSAYPNSTHIITPYKDNGYLSAKQRKFNYLHSSTRVCIEQAFGLLKGRFRILKFVNMMDTKFIPEVIIACCILHNICMQNGDTDVDEIYFEENVNDADELLESDELGGSKRLLIFTSSLFFWTRTKILKTNNIIF